MGKVHGDKKLKTPATNARRVKTIIPESGRLGLGANGLNGAAVLDAVFGDADFSIVPVVAEEFAD